MQFNVEGADGQTRTVESGSAQNLMEVIRDNGYDELLAVCGGELACATCHVYVNEAELDRLPPMSETEDMLLDMSAARRPNSRLSCQIACTDAISGLSVTIAP